MKAKEYYQKFLNNTDNHSKEYLVINALKDMCIEVADIIKQRKIKSDEAAFNVIKEVNQKANSYIKMVNQHLEDELVNNALLYFIENEMPSLKDVIQKLK